MFAGKLLVKVATLAPILAVAGMGYEARRPHTPFKFLEYNQEESATLDAYIPLLAKLGELPVRKVNHAEIHTFADYWISKIGPTGLQPLLPAFYEESDEEGPRNQVFLAWDRILSELEIAEYEESKAGEWHETAADFHRILVIVNSLKYSDTATLSSANSQVRGLIGRINADAAHFSKEDRTQLANDLENSTNVKDFHAMMERSKANLEAYEIRSDAIRNSDPENAQDDSETPMQETKSEEFCARVERHLVSEIATVNKVLRS